MEENDSEVTPYYVELAEQAKLHGVSVSVISLIGAECCLEKLSIVTEQSAGTVQRVDPLDLSGQLSALVDKPVLGYTTMAMILLHRGLMFRGEMDDEQDNRYWVVRDMGNVNADTELTISYGFRPKDQYDLTNIDKIPFQVQLMYSKPSGARYLRIATAMVEATDNREQAEKLADIRVIGTHAALRAAKFAKEGNYEKAQMEARSAQRFMSRNAMPPEQLNRWTAQVSQFDDVVRNERKNEGKKVKSKKSIRSDQAVEAISKGTTLNSCSLFD